jgi:peroxiredoxin
MPPVPGPSLDYRTVAVQNSLTTWECETETNLRGTAKGDTSLNRNDTQKMGEPVEDFSLQRTTGGTVSLGEALEGKQGGVVVFWSGICSHCVRYDAYLNSFQAKHPELGFIAIASRQGESPQAVMKQMAERNLTFPMVLDPGGNVAAKWQAQQTPRAYLLDARRAVIYRGAIDNYKYSDDPEQVEYLEPAIDQFLSGVPLTRQETASFGCAIQSVYYVLPKAL